MTDGNLLSADALVKIRERAEKDLYFFAKGILGYDWFATSVHKPLCRLLELYDGWNDTLCKPRREYIRVLMSPHIEPKLSKASIRKILRRGLKKLQVVLPRGWLKTTMCSVAYPLWRAIRDSNVRCLLVQNTHSNAAAKNKTIRQQVEKNILIQILWPDILPTPDCPWRDESLCLNRPGSFPESTFECAGTKTQVISRHYGVIIEDDTVAPDKDELQQENIAPTKDDVVQAIGWHRLVPPLLLNPMESQSLVVGTRWFEKDLISWQRESDNVGLVCYTRSCLELPNGQSSEVGEITYPERFNWETLESLKQSMGPYLFSCLYLNKPLRSEDMIFLPEWIKYYDQPPLNLLVYTTVDLGGDPEDTKGEPDFNVVMTCGKDKKTGIIYVLDYFRKKCSPGEVINALFLHVRKYHPLKVGVESVAYQKSIKYFIRERQKAEEMFFFVEGLTQGNRSKGVRIIGLQPGFANGTILLRTWMKELVGELLIYPLGQNDDLIDALSSQLAMWALTRGEEKSRREQEQANDPLSVDWAIQCLKERAKQRDKLPGVMDVFIQEPEWTGL